MQFYEFCSIFSAVRTSHLEIVVACTHFFTNLFRSCKERSLVMQEIAPMVHRLPLRRLIGNKTNHPLLFVFLPRQNRAKCLFHRDICSPHSAANVQEKLVHERTVERMVDLSEMDASIAPKWKRGNPFPIAKVSQVEEYKLMFSITQLSKHLMKIDKIHATIEFFARNRHQFKCFHDVIGKPVVEIALYLRSLLSRT